MRGHRVEWGVWAINVSGSTYSDLPDCLGWVTAMESVLILKTAQILCVVQMAKWMSIVPTVG